LVGTRRATSQASSAFIQSSGLPRSAFIVNRILLPMINEAIYTLYEGVGNVEGIDTAMR
jgi:3-hydroxybutyryl-CoA dehydrogenase